MVVGSLDLGPGVSFDRMVDAGAGAVSGGYREHKQFSVELVKAFKYLDRANPRIR